MILDVGEFAVNELILGNHWIVAMESLGLSPPAGRAGFWFLIFCFVMGIVLVWLYSTMRPRFGLGFKTSIISGLAIWFLVWVWGFGARSSLVFILSG